MEIPAKARVGFTGFLDLRENLGNVKEKPTRKTCFSRVCLFVCVCVCVCVCVRVCVRVWVFILFHLLASSDCKTSMTYEMFGSTIFCCEFC